MERKGLLSIMAGTPLNRRCFCVLIGAVLFANLFIYFSLKGLTATPNEVILSKNPLLLNSGLVEAKEAELRIVIWFERGKPEGGFLDKLPQENWVWKESDITNSINRSYLLAGSTTIDQKSEPAIYIWYQSLAQKVSQAGGMAYLDERVAEGLDVAQYALRENISPRQLTFSEGIYSVVGWHKAPLPMVLAGGDKVNIQLVSQGYGQGKTALAMPVLLEEF